jgi:hypothetical protein
MEMATEEVAQLMFLAGDMEIVNPVEWDDACMVVQSILYKAYPELRVYCE